ncbi:MAG TPA: SDR family oxidoreductase [Arenicellales bacterium]|jgi:NAD(P)-dependent dehydrogenase (short-subunit alcohol dehydrogenase family)|nr:SDR family oxidoreductase [Arenicellales bacterium]|tara:strand:+ start:1037 stop:1798 length:762 start_codon:yes stop_codon:yes gene_type:complete
MTQRVLVTAGAGGIGRVIAETFDQQGAKIWVVDVDSQALDECPDHWQKSCIDVTDEPAVIDLFSKLRDRWGSLDTLCSNAGIAGPGAPVEDIAIEDWRECVSVSLEGAFLFAKHATPLMKAQESGAIIMTSSTAGIFGFANRSPYTAAKWGVIGLMKTLAIELGPFNIRANAICPGPVEGERMTFVAQREAQVKGKTTEQILDEYASGSSMRKLVGPQDIAHMAVFLASDQAKLVSGQVIAVDGHTENPEPRH